MNAPEPYVGRLTTVEAALEAERLLAAFDARDETFAQRFYEADRDTLGAVLAYASGAVRAYADVKGFTLAEVRQALRLRISEVQSMIEKNGAI